MVAAVYSSDLSAQNIWEDGATFTAVTVAGGGGGQTTVNNPETDDYIQGVNCSSRNGFNSSTRGMYMDNGSGVTLGTGEVFWFWTKADIAQALDTKALGGIQVLIGSSTSAYDAFYVGGSDDPFGGWKCYPVDPSETPDIQYSGGNGGTDRYFGVAWKIPGSGPTKGAPFKCDAFRYGRWFGITEGDNGQPATFLAAANFQGAITRQWGQFQLQNGTFLQQGGFRFGAAATACYFEDSSRAIFIANTEKVGAGFNRFEVLNSGSTVILNSISMTALGVQSRGDFVVVDNATVTLNACAFTGMGIFTFNSGVNPNTLSACTFNATDVLTLGGASMTGGSVLNSRVTGTTGAILTDNTDFDNLDGVAFKRGSAGHAVKLDIPSAGTYNFTWNCTAPTAASPTGDEYRSGATGNGITPTSNGDELIHIDVASGNPTINIEVLSGGTTPSIRLTGTATINITAGNLTLTLKGWISGATLVIYDDDSADPQELGTELQRNNNITADEAYVYPPGKAGDDIVVVLLAAGYKLLQQTITLGANSADFTLEPELETN